MVLGQGFSNLLVETAKLLFIFLAPFVGFALIIHWLERITQRRLVERFGWHSVLWTGWLGTPIHELSHAFMCRVFQHRIDEIALFEPDHADRHQARQRSAASAAPILTRLWD